MILDAGAELGTRPQYCDNKTLFSGGQIVANCIVSLFNVATPLRHRDLYIFEFFLVTEALLYYVVVVTKLNKFSRAQLCILSPAVQTHFEYFLGFYYRQLFFKSAKCTFQETQML